MRRIVTYGFLGAVAMSLAGPANTQEPKATAKKPAVLAADLSPPIALQSGGKFIDVDVGHSAPFVGDLGDGKLSLLVGQFGDGKLRAYPMTKKGDSFELGALTWVKAADKECSVPSG
jgi:hypothetical protein